MPITARDWSKAPKAHQPKNWGVSVRSFIAPPRFPLPFPNHCGKASQVTVPARQFPQHDANFNVTAITNTSGTVQERYTPDPFGVVTFRDASGNTISASAKDWVFLHQGGQADILGHYDFRNRILSPTLGRWLTNDPLGFAAGDVNFYSILKNNPINSLDQFGLIDWEKVFDYLKKTKTGTDLIKCICNNKNLLKIYESSYINYYYWSIYGKVYTGWVYGHTIWGKKTPRGYYGDIYTGKNAGKDEQSDIIIAMTLVHELTHYCIGFNKDENYNSEPEARMAELKFIDEILKKLNGREKAEVGIWIKYYQENGMIDFKDGKIIINEKKYFENYGNKLKSLSSPVESDYGKIKPVDFNKICKCK